MNYQIISTQQNDTGIIKYLLLEDSAILGEYFQDSKGKWRAESYISNRKVKHSRRDRVVGYLKGEK